MCPLEVLNQMVDLHKTQYKHYATSSELYRYLKTVNTVFREFLYTDKYKHSKDATSSYQSFRYGQGDRKKENRKGTAQIQITVLSYYQAMF